MSAKREAKTRTFVVREGTQVVVDGVLYAEGESITVSEPVPTELEDAVRSGWAHEVSA